jgi:transcription initiation factor TFIIB
MVWHSIPDQILIQDREFKRTNKKRLIRHSIYDLSKTNKENIDFQNDVSKHSRTLCSMCKRNDKIVTDPESGEIICGNCGMVISDKVEDTAHLERQIFREGQIDDTRARTGAPTSLARHDMGLATVIGRDNRDASGQKIDPSISSAMQRLRMWDFRVQQNNTPSDRNLRTAFNLLNTLKNKLGLSDAIVEKIAYIYRKAQERGFVRGRSISAVLAAAVYITYRDLGVPKTMKDIAVASNVKRKNIARVYRQLILELDYKVPNPDPVKCIAKLANNTNLSEKTKRQAFKIMKEVTENEISAGKDPMGVAATVLYVSCIKTGENISQKDISNAAGITDVTLRNRFKDLKNQIAVLN